MGGHGTSAVIFDPLLEKKNVIAPSKAKLNIETYNPYMCSTENFVFLLFDLPKFIVNL